METLIQSEFGTVVRTQVLDGRVDLTNQRAISLNVDPDSVVRYLREGDNLRVLLADGRELVLEGFFEAGSIYPTKQLYLSSEGEIVGVEFSDEIRQTRVVKYSEAELGDALVFNSDAAIGGAQVSGAATGGFVDGAGVALAALGGLAAAGLVFGGSSSSSGAVVSAAPVSSEDPTPDQSGEDRVPTVTINPLTTDIINSNNDARGIEFTGTGDAGADVEVIIGETTYQTRVLDDGTWSIDVSEANLPADGDYTVVVSSSFPGGTAAEINAGGLIVDRTNPDLNATAEVLVAEQSGAGEVVFQVNAPDAFDVQYSLLQGQGDDVGRFTIDTETGEVTLLDNPDHSIKTAYDFTVVAVDANGNQSEQDVRVNVANIPDVIDVELTSLAGAGNAINEGDLIQVQVMFDDTVDVSSLGGSPSVNLMVGDALRQATYIGGANTDTLTFQYTVQAGDNDGDGVFVPSDGLQLNGATIVGNSFNLSANLAHLGESGDTAIVVDTTAPAVQITGQFEATNARSMFLNSAALETGVEVTGTAEVGSRVTVTFGGVQSETVLVGNSGIWTATFDSSDLQGIESVSSITATATDAAGNASTVFGRNVEVDSTPPEDAAVTDVLESARSGLVIGVDIVEEAGVDYQFFENASSGQVTNLASQSIRSGFEFDRDLAEDSSLLIRATERSSGNESNTFLVLDDGVELTGAEISAIASDLTSINLNSADNTELSLTADDLADIAGPSDTVVVSGGSDDTVRLDNGFVSDGIKIVDANLYNSFTNLDGDLTLLVDSDIDIEPAGIA